MEVAGEAEKQIGVNVVPKPSIEPAKIVIPREHEDYSGENVTCSLKSPWSNVINYSYYDS